MVFCAVHRKGKVSHVTCRILISFTTTIVRHSAPHIGFANSLTGRGPEKVEALGHRALFPKVS